MCQRMFDFLNSNQCRHLLLLLLPLAFQPNVGFSLSNNVLPFLPICHQLSPSSHSQHLKISFHFFSPSFPGSSPSSHPLQFLSEDLFGHPILLHSLQVTQPTYPFPFSVTIHHPKTTTFKIPLVMSLLKLKKWFEANALQTLSAAWHPSGHEKQWRWFTVLIFIPLKTIN